MSMQRGACADSMRLSRSLSQHIRALLCAEQRLLARDIKTRGTRSAPPARAFLRYNNSPLKLARPARNVLGAPITPKSGLSGRCALSVDVERIEACGHVRGVAVTGIHAEGRQSAPLSRPVRFARCMLMTWPY